MCNRQSMKKDFARPFAIRQVEFLDEEFIPKLLLTDNETGKTEGYSKYPIVRYFAENTQFLNFVVAAIGLDIIKLDSWSRELYPFMTTTEGETFGIENEDIVEMLCLRANIEVSKEGMIILYNKDAIVVTATCDKATKIDLDSFKEITKFPNLYAITEVLTEEGKTIVTLKTTDNKVLKYEMNCLFDLFDMDLIDVEFKKL